uniref:Uncharacterized protein n=1 Tax=Arundo donax TaxID=35708 RepID=A0A0A9BW96_ARUDO
MENFQLDGPSPDQEHLSGESTSVQQRDENETVEENRKDKCSCPPLDNYKDVTSLKNEISLLNKRLKAVEADQEFLKKVLSSLTYGSDGLQFVQEITSHLAELRRVVMQ